MTPSLINKNSSASGSKELNKYKKIADTLSLNENSKTLEIGCGWGGFSSFIAKNYKCKVDAITIASEVAGPPTTPAVTLVLTKAFAP